MEVKKLSGHESMNCFVEVEENAIRLISYTTLVVDATKVDDKWFVIPRGQFWDGDRVYTPTTARHISLFLREYFKDITYQQIKKVAISNCKNEPIAITAERR